MAVQQKFRGFSIIEIVIAAAIVATVVTGIAGAWQFYIKMSGQSTRMAAAALLIEEGAEALQLLRDQSWSENISLLEIGTAYHFVWNGSAYEATTTQVAIDGLYYRKLIMNEVARDISANIAEAGTIDSGTRRASLSIYAGNEDSGPILSAEMLIHDVFNN